MNVTVEDLAPCKKLVRVEVDAKAVEESFETVSRDFQKQASLPGFRPGKAPLEVVVRKYDKDIQDEVRKKLMGDSYRKAIEEQKLDVLGYPDIEEIQFARGQNLMFAATVETAPQFEVPEYKAIPVQRDTRTVSDKDVEDAVNVLAQRQATFNTVTRPLQAGDVAVVNYTGTCDGQPIKDLAPAAQGLAEKKGFWIEIGSNSFIPGFADQLQGAKAGDKRTVNVDFPADFVTPQLAGKKGVYETEVVEVKERVLPPQDEAFAKAFGAESLDKLKEGVRRDLENELKTKQNRDLRAQLIRSLVSRVNFELPETAVARETRNVVYDIVQENSKRGIARNVIEENKEQIYSAATQNARERVKIAFLLQKIAEKEDIKVSEEEIGRRIYQLAAMYQIPADKFAKDLQKRGGMIEVFDQIMNEKVLDYLQKNAAIQDAPAPAQS